MNCADKLPMCTMFFVRRCFPGHSNTAYFQDMKACMKLTAPFTLLVALGEDL